MAFIDNISDCDKFVVIFLVSKTQTGKSLIVSKLLKITGGGGSNKLFMLITWKRVYFNFFFLFFFMPTVFNCLFKKCHL